MNRNMKRVHLYLTDDGGEASCGIISCDRLVKLGVIKLQTLQKGPIASLSFSAKDVEKTT